MRMIFAGVLVLGLALAGFAVYMAQNFIGHTQAQLAKEREMRAKTGPLVEVYVVNKPVNYGDALTRDDVQLIYWPQSALPEGIFKASEPLFPEGETRPRFVLRQMEKFEPVLAVKITEPGEVAGLTGMLAQGERAFTIKFDDASGASRYLQPGNRVDVYWTGSSSMGGEVTQMIETSLAIIAVDRPPAKNAKGASSGTDFAAPKAMTVAATPQQVARLAQGQATGQLSVSLVAKTDDNTPIAGPIEVNSDQLLGIQREAAAPEVEKKVCTIKTRKGADVLEIPIPCTN
ncbi:Flp pilus assembly protein CpaB [Gemmobacter lutimaris]|uniref:Flp pilus assembly protein CpaB n=1 Tax=Gemmobacter lutimaris TaxID=2306023 RepID=A0A398BR31_9RHOB|nr:Flp pilus assembly protein CpaB [Gemmobacter lutimaris]RID92204.1 Flp pilus assembly protein CpaB [Gemmobacter lutimaris]